MVFCKTNLDCPSGLEYCHKNQQTSIISSLPGVCGPIKCNSDGKCPIIGDSCSRGSIIGTCNVGKCNYESGLVMAYCAPSE